MVTIEPRTAVVTIFQGDYMDRIRHLEQRHKAATDAEKSGPPRMNSEIPESVEIAKEHKALVAEAEATALNVTVRALTRRAWRELVAEHPVRDGNRADAVVGVNEDTFKDALVPLSIVEPVLTEDDLEVLSDAQWDQIYYTAFDLNRGTPSPKALLVSQSNPESDET